MTKRRESLTIQIVTSGKNCYLNKKKLVDFRIVFKSIEQAEYTQI